MKVVLTVAGMDNESAGPSYTVPSLANALSDAGAQVDLLALGNRPDLNWRCSVLTYPRAKFRLLRRIGWSRKLKKDLVWRAASTDILHVNGVWQFPDVYPADAARGTSCKVVHCPRGGLSPTALWRGNTLVKKLMWYLGGQRRALREAAMFHAASVKEYEEIRALGFGQPVAIVPNGIEVPELPHRPFAPANRKLVFFGRLHATKAADHLVAAWGRVAAEFPEWSLEIAGPDCGALPQLKAMVAEGRIPRVTFAGELKGRAKYEFLANADLYALPSLTENFGITIAEALACGTPVIASKGCPWPGILGEGKGEGEGRCGWWIDVGVESLERCLRDALKTSPEALEAMGKVGRAWMERDFTWPGIGRKMLAAYEWLLRGGKPPEWVRED